jgi:adenylylsulfate kinase
MLDGDSVRDVLGDIGRSNGSYGRASRIELAGVYGRLCYLLASQGFTVVISTISLFREVHSWNRLHLPNYFEVYLRVPKEVLARRNRKGLYVGEGGSLGPTNVVGVDLAFDEPEQPDWIVEYGESVTASATAEELVRRMLGSRDISSAT